MAGLDLGNIKMRIEADISAYEASMKKVDATAKSLKSTLEDASKTKVDVKPSGVAELDKAGKSAEKTAEALEQVKKTKPSVKPEGVSDLEKATQTAKKASDELDKASKKKPNFTPTGTEQLGDAASKARKAREEIDQAANSVGRFSSGLKGIAGFAFGAAGLGTLGAAFTSTVQSGNNFTKSMNTMAAVSQATDAQLSAVGQRARELGTAIDLPATSAADAALAMSELAKGGFTVEQSMTAAKGTLQLAAAAQVDAASAATIQVQALQAFNLQADQAGRVADVLAGAANASSAEFTDVAMALQQAGTVAKGFGISIEDTATAIAMFANAGITGSDAGTLLKTSLLAITDQGKPAQKAIEDLGLTLYDSQQRFVGLESMFQQLSEAQGRMSDEAYQAATNTLFGSDAIRQAMVAAQQGGDGFSKLREAVSRQGQAAEVAAAQTRGLPGAINQVGNSIEDLQQRVYDAVDGEATALMQGLAGGITKVGTAILGVPFEVWAAGTAMLLGRFTGLSSGLNTGTAAITTFARKSLEASAAAKAQGQSVSVISAAMTQLGTKSQTISAMNAAYARGAAPLAALSAKHREAALAARLQAAANRELNATMTGSTAIPTFKAGLASLGSTAAGVASGGFSLLKSGASGLLAVLGGPWGAAITAGGAALGLLAKHHQDAAAAEATHKAEMDALQGSLSATTGAITDQTRALQLKAAEESGWLNTARSLGVEQGVIVDAMNGSTTAVAQVGEAVKRANVEALQGTEFWGKYGDRIKAAGGDVNDFAAAISGDSAALQRANETLEKLGYETFGPSARAQWQGVQQDIKKTNEEFLALNEGVGSSAQKFTEAQLAAQSMALEALLSGDKLTNLFSKIGDSIVQIPDEKNIVLTSAAPALRSELEALGAKVTDLPDGTVNVEFPNGFDIAQLLDLLQVKTETLPDGRIDISDNAQDVIDRVVDLGLATKDPKTGEVIIKDNLASVMQQTDDLRSNVQKGMKGRAEISDNFGPTIKNIDYVNSQNGKKTTQTHTVIEVRETHRREYWQSMGLPENTQGPVPMRRAAGGLHGYDDGGRHGGYRLPLTGPGTETTDGFLALDREGIPTAWVDAGEWIINRRSSETYHTPLAYLNQGDTMAAVMALLEELPGFNTGGVSGRVKRTLGGMNGTPYIFGGFSPRGTDCSGAVSAAVNVAEGVPAFQSRMATGSAAGWLAQRGYRRGKGGPGTLRIGVLHGGPGGGHTAMQLPDGTYIESGGNTGGGFTIGGKAGPLEGRGFTDWYFKQYESGDPELTGTSFSSEVVNGAGAVSGGGSFSGGFRASSRGLGFQAAEGSEADAVRMGVTGSIASLAGKKHMSAFRRELLSLENQAISAFPGAEGEIKSLEIIKKIDAEMEKPLGKLGEFLLVTEKTVEAFNKLGEARQAEVDAIEDYREAEQALAELKKDSTREDRNRVEKIQEAEKNLAKARKDAAKPAKDGKEKKDRSDEIAKKEKAVRDAREGASEKAIDDANKLAKAERNLEDARQRVALQTAKAAQREEEYRVALLLAPLEQLGTAIQFVGELAGFAADTVGVLVGIEQRRVERAEKAMGIWEANINAQKQLQEAYEASAQAARDLATQRWKSDLEVSDAEWELTLHRKRSQKELAESSVFATNVAELQAQQARRTATLESAIALAKARRDYDSFERERQLAETQSEYAFQQRQAGFATERLALVSAVLVDIQNELSQGRLLELQAQQEKAEADTTKAGGWGKIISGVLSLGGAAAAATTGAGIPAAIAMGIGGVTALLGGAVDIFGARQRGKIADEKLGHILDRSKRGGLDGKLSDLDNAQRIANAKREEEVLTRRKDSSNQLDVLAKLLDVAEKEFELAKRSEQQANDIASLMEENNQNAAVFFQLGGSSWAGKIDTTEFTPTKRGFAGIQDSRLSAGSSLEVVGGMAADQVSRGRSPAVAGAAAAVVSAQETSAIRVHMTTLVKLAERITTAVEKPSQTKRGDTIGTVISGPVTVNNADGRGLVTALAAKG